MRRYFFLGTIMVPGYVWAAGIGAVAQRIRDELTGIAMLLGGLSFLLGLIMAMIAIGRLLAHGRDPIRFSMGDVIWRAVAAAMFIALPEVLGVGVSTLFGENATILDSTGDGLVGALRLG
ncbi:MAG: hypothetical protein EBT20_10590 [Alphaproteobacteria bacterium]|jgi:formate/nitrite transporter FocA (FNT family)|nr:hypothetical protein [Alphaproteobacteria bacterium]